MLEFKQCWSSSFSLPPRKLKLELQRRWVKMTPQEVAAAVRSPSRPVQIAVPTNQFERPSIPKK